MAIRALFRDAVAFRETPRPAEEVTVTATNGQGVPEEKTEETAEEAAASRSAEEEEARTIQAVDVALQAACAVALSEPRPRVALRLRTTSGVEARVPRRGRPIVRSFGRDTGASP